MAEPERTEDTTALVQRCREGDERAWSALVRRYGDLVFSTAHSCGLGADDALEVHQQVWVELYRSLLRLRDAQALPRWLIVTTQRLSIKHAMRSKRFVGEVSVELADPRERPDDRLLGLENRQMVEQALIQLDERCEKVLRMFFHDENTSYRKVADELGIKEDSVGSVRTRCLRRMREILESA